MEKEGVGGRTSLRGMTVRTPGMRLRAFGVHMFEEDTKIEEINPLTIYFQQKTLVFFFFLI